VTLSEGLGADLVAFATANGIALPIDPTPVPEPESLNPASGEACRCLYTSAKLPNVPTHAIADRRGMLREH